MSIFDTVKAELGTGPDYPSRSAFTTYFGYAGGKSLGEFPTMDAAKTAGAATTEKSVDREAYETAMAAYRAHNDAITAEWYRRVRAEYPGVSDDVFAAAYALAYDRGHSSGYGEVELYLSDYVEFAEKVIALSKA